MNNRHYSILSKINTGWQLYKMSELANIKAGGTPSTFVEQFWVDGRIPWMNSGDLNKRFVFDVNGRITEQGQKNSSTFLVPKHSVLVGLAGQGKTRGTVAINEIDLCINQSIAAIMPKSSDVYYLFLFYNLDSRYGELRKISAGDGGRGGLNLSIIGNIDVLLPTFGEQKEIARILNTWDRAIERVQRLIETKQRQKAKLVSQLLSGRMRFPGFQNEWKPVKLGTFLHPKFRKVVKPDGAYLRLGIRSHGKGTFTSVVDDPETIALTHLFQARKDDLIVNITFAWEGAIALVGPDGDGALVSHRFPTYVFDTSKMLPEYFKHLMVTDRFVYGLDLISPGGAGRNRVMNKGDFLKITVTIPGIEEQKKIAGVLGGVDEQIALLKKYLEKLKEQKKGLMQKLLTGEIRVKVD